jgi:hypothetical protein
MARPLDSFSAQTRDDLERLLGDALSSAKFMLDEQGEFFPYAMAMTTGGDIQPIATYPGEDASSTIDSLVKAFTQYRANWREVGLVSEMALADGDAVQVELEHSDGSALVVQVRYSGFGQPHGVEYGSRAHATSESRIWPDA